MPESNLTVEPASSKVKVSRQNKVSIMEGHRKIRNDDDEIAKMTSLSLCRCAIWTYSVPPSFKLDINVKENKHEFE